MTKFERAEKAAEVSMLRAFYRRAMERYETAKTLAEKMRAKAELESREREYFSSTGFAFA